jgi:cephalosporin-C deacetylase
MSIPSDHSFAFDPSYGMRLQDLLAIKILDEPVGFDDFWSARYAQAVAVDPHPAIRKSTTTDPRWLVHDITYISTGGFTIGGWLLVPRDGPVRRGLVVGHGYGGRDAPDYDIPVEETAVLFPCFRGLSRSAHPSISPDAGWHVLNKIDKPQDYVIGGCVEDLWVAVSVLESCFPHVKGHIGYSGISFGGGIGALALPFDARIDRGHLIVPTFGNRPLWLTLPTIGSAAAVQAYQKRHPNVLETLRFFDAATAASRIRIPMLVAVALFDPAVAPPCQFSVANALPKSKFNEIFILDAGHFEYAGEDVQHEAHMTKVGQFFRAP